MSRFRDIKRKMRRDLHNQAKVPALYLVNADADPVRVYVRDHTNSAGAEATVDAYDGLAMRMVPSPRLLIDTLEIPKPVRNAYVVLGPTEIYQIKLSEASYGDFQAVDADREREPEAIWQAEWAELLQ